MTTAVDLPGGPVLLAPTGGRIAGAICGEGGRSPADRSTQGGGAGSDGTASTDNDLVVLRPFPALVIDQPVSCPGEPTAPVAFPMDLA
jgi:hypothetical protein